MIRLRSFYSNREGVESMIEAGATRIGASSSVAIVQGQTGNSGY
jgi:deoxyribose-phosphate aldolase